jgi:hypothetical protein
VTEFNNATGGGVKTHSRSVKMFEFAGANAMAALSPTDGRWRCARRAVQSRSGDRPPMAIDRAAAAFSGGCAADRDSLYATKDDTGFRSVRASAAARRYHHRCGGGLAGGRGSSAALAPARLISSSN